MDRPLVGVGLGLRWEFLEDVLSSPDLPVAFFEISPENYMRRGGFYPAALDRIRERYPVVTHGLTLSLGAVDEPDPSYVRDTKEHVARMRSPWHSDHLSFSTVGDHVLHELLPLKFCEENVHRVADRVRRISDAMGVPIAIENVTWYAHPGRAHMSELEFIHRVLDASGARLLLDVNNVYVNAMNHGFDPYAFIGGLPLDRVVEIHVAGHSRIEGGMILDTHGAEVSDPVLDLLEWTLARTGPVAVLLERDHHVPELTELLAEMARISVIYDRAAGQQVSAPSRPVSLSACESPNRTSVRALERALGELTLGPELDDANPRDVEAFLFRHDVAPEDAEALRDGGLARLRVYRRLVRGSLRQAVQAVLERTSARLGDAFEETFDAFLRERPPQSRYLRDLTAEFLDFCLPRWQADPRIPPYLPDLARHEALHVEMAAMVAATFAPPPVDLSLDAELAFIPAVRLVRYVYAVHRLSESPEDRACPEPTPVALLVYRSHEHDVRYLELTPMAEAILRRLVDRRTLGEAITGACEELSAAPSETILNGAASLLADLAERGVWIGAKVRS